jgi:hypothetical protein
MGIKQLPDFVEEVMEDVFHDMEDFEVYIDKIDILGQSREHHQTIIEERTLPSQRQRFHCQPAQVQVGSSTDWMARFLAYARRFKILEEKY